MTEVLRAREEMVGEEEGERSERCKKRGRWKGAAGEMMEGKDDGGGEMDDTEGRRDER